MIKVLLVDDSSVILSMLSRMLSSSPDFKVVATAINADFAKKAIDKHQPDVMLLDIVLPGKDGITFLKEQMAAHPIRTMIVSSLSVESSKTSLEALAAGAIDVMEKPAITKDNFESLKKEIIERVRAVAAAKLQGEIKAVVSQGVVKFSGQFEKDLILIAASTGGTEALKKVIPRLPKGIPPIVIVQHMPPGFTKTFAERLNKLSQLTVKEAVDQEVLTSGYCYIVPGDYHLEIQKVEARYMSKLNQDEVTEKR